nr:immunoglobulin light chain junction region [Macaca mulatta]
CGQGTHWPPFTF